MAWLTRRRGETSTAWRRAVPPPPMRVASSRGPELLTASTRTWIGFFPVIKRMISNAWKKKEKERMRKERKRRTRISKQEKREKKRNSKEKEKEKSNKPA